MIASTGEYSHIRHGAEHFTHAFKSQDNLVGRSYNFCIIQMKKPRL